MATKLTKPVVREALSTDRKGRTLIVSLEPGDILTFRPKGRKHSVSVYLGHCFMLAQIMDTEHRYKEALEKYNQERKLGLRKRRPKKPTLPFSKVYFQALK